MKPEPFLLENASWPALLLEGGTIRRANQAAISFFGPKLEGDTTMLSAIWSEENEAGPDQVLAKWERSAMGIVPLKFRGKGTSVTTFSTLICTLSRDGVKRFVLQLFRDSPAAGTSPASPASSAQAAQSSDTSLARKQKLDCALNLTRTAALDFNNALTSILGHASLVLSKMESEDPWRDSLLEVEKAAERAAEIAHQLGAFGRQEKETRDLPSGNLNLVLRRVVEMFQRNKTKAVNWSVDLENKLYTVKFDEAKLTQAVVKIIENAVQAVGEAGHVSVRTLNRELSRPCEDGTATIDPGCYVCVEITDDGCGIPAEVLPRIFEPFFTTKPGHRGLGLAWVYGIITNHGGAVAVSSEPDHGTTVRVYLRAARRALVERAAHEVQAQGTERILVVDDEDPILTLAQAILTSRGYEVLIAHSGEEALELFAKTQPPVDLVITDVVMPSMSGKELMDQIRLRSPSTPMIYSSGCVPSATDEEDDGYLRKPFTSQELLRRVQHALAGAQAG
jgi:signal transduction histidine kinase